jgi:hypothetical protein
MSRLFIPLSCSLFLVFIVERSENKSLFVLLKGHAGNTCKKNATSVRMLISVKKPASGKSPLKPKRSSGGRQKRLRAIYGRYKYRQKPRGTLREKVTNQIHGSSPEKTKEFYLLKIRLCRGLQAMHHGLPGQQHLCHQNV